MAANWDDELQQLIQLTFRQRHEEMLACKAVVITGRSKRFKTPKPRFLVLCRPFSAAGTTSSTSNSTLNVVQVGPERVVNVKLVFSVARLVDMGQEGSLDAAFNFGSGGMLSVKFESYIQRQMFIAAVRSVHCDVQLLAPAVGTDRKGVHTLLLDEMGIVKDNNIVTQVMTQRQVKRSALTTEDEQQLQDFIGPHSFDDIRATENLLSTRQKKAELLYINDLVSSSNEWEGMRDGICRIVREVEELEEHIARYSRRILSQKDQLQRIENQYNMLQRKQENLEKLREHMHMFNGQLDLPQHVQNLLQRLERKSEEDFMLYLSDDNNARLVSDAVNTITSLLQDTRPEVDYHIAAVMERRAAFTVQRRMVVQRFRAYVLSTIKQYEDIYLSDTQRFSTGNMIVWKKHTELVNKLMGVRDLINAFKQVDTAGFIAVLRRYRACMQRVYAREMHHFFKYLRAQLKRAGSHSSFLIGSRESPDEGTMTGNDSTCVVTPRLQTSSNHNDSWQFTPASTSLGARSFSCAGSSFSQRTDITNGGMLSVDLPVAQQDSLRLYDPARARTPAAGHQRSASSGSILSLISSRKRGHLDPDVALAMAFETVVCMVLHEEETLRLCFGLTEGDDQGNNDVDSEGELFLPTTDRTQGCVKVDRATLLRESLAELFGGEKVVIFSPGISGASLTEDPQGGKSYPSTRRGSSCSTSVAVKGEECPDEDESCSASSRSYLQRQLVDLLKYVGERCDRLYMLPVMVMIKAYRRSGSVVASSSFCQMIFQALEPVLASTVSRSVMEQTASIKTCTRRYLINPSGLLICFLKLPTFVQKLESMHDALPPALRSHKEYTSYVLTLVDQCFESLNCVTNLTKSEASCEVKLSRLECLSRRGYRIFNGNGESTKSADHSFLQQYRHHAFFCSFYDSLHPMCNAVGLLRERYESSCALRDRYQELYLTRVVLVKEFPEFGPFALVAEDLAQVHTVDELRHHSTFSVDAMRNIVADMSQEVRNGIKRSSEKMKKHFLRDVARRKDEVSFNCMLLQQVWSSFTTLFLQKFDFLSAVAEWPIYTDLEVPITREEVVALLETV